MRTIEDEVMAKSLTKKYGIFRQAVGNFGVLPPLVAQLGNKKAISLSSSQENRKQHSYRVVLV